MARARTAKKETGNSEAPKTRGGGAKRIYDTLRREILELELRPGELLEESAIGSRFGMSRVPVREALIRLSMERLVTTLPNKNTLVAPLNLEAFPEYVDALDVNQRVITRLAAQYRSQKDLDRIKEAQDVFHTAIGNSDVLAMIEANRNFHIVISEAGGNQYFTETITRLLDEGRRMQRIYFRSFDDHLPPEFSDEHVEIIKAIENQDADLAERLAHEHTRQVSEQFLACLGTRKTDDFVLVKNTTA